MRLTPVSLLLLLASMVLCSCNGDKYAAQDFCNRIESAAITDTLLHKFDIKVEAKVLDDDALEPLRITFSNVDRTLWPDLLTRLSLKVWQESEEPLHKQWLDNEYISNFCYTFKPNENAPYGVTCWSLDSKLKEFEANPQYEPNVFEDRLYEQYLARRFNTILSPGQKQNAVSTGKGVCEIALRSDYNTKANDGKYIEIVYLDKSLPDNGVQGKMTNYGMVLYNPADDIRKTIKESPEFRALAMKVARSMGPDSTTARETAGNLGIEHIFITAKNSTDQSVMGFRVGFAVDSLLASD